MGAERPRSRVPVVSEVKAFSFVSDLHPGMHFEIFHDADGGGWRVYALLDKPDETGRLRGWVVHEADDRLPKGELSVERLQAWAIEQNWG
jgi:hypothetical protein